MQPITFRHFHSNHSDSLAKHTKHGIIGKAISSRPSVRLSTDINMNKLRPFSPMGLRPKEYDIKETLSVKMIQGWGSGS